MAESKYPPYIQIDGSRATPKAKRNIIDTLVHWIWIIGSIIPTIIINAARLMVTPGTVAAQTVGGLIMLTGMLMSADAYWQLWSRQPALFHFFEASWLGWGWVPRPVITLIPPSFSFYTGLLFNGNFMVAIIISSAVQVIQSVTFRSGNFKGAAIAGISAKTIGLIAWGSWAFDFWMAFGSRNPFQFTDMGERLACISYVVFSVFASELGYIVFMMMRETKE